MEKFNLYSKLFSDCIKEICIIEWGSEDRLMSLKFGGKH